MAIISTIILIIIAYLAYVTIDTKARRDKELKTNPNFNESIQLRLSTLFDHFIDDGFSVKSLKGDSVNFYLSDLMRNKNFEITVMYHMNNQIQFIYQSYDLFSNKYIMTKQNMLDIDIDQHKMYKEHEYFFLEFKNINTPPITEEYSDISIKNSNHSVNKEVFNLEDFKNGFKSEMIEDIENWLATHKDENQIVKGIGLYSYIATLTNSLKSKYDDISILFKNGGYDFNYSRFEYEEIITEISDSISDIYIK